MKYSNKKYRVGLEVDERFSVLQIPRGHSIYFVGRSDDEIFVVEQITEDESVNNRYRIYTGRTAKLERQHLSSSRRHKVLKRYYGSLIIDYSERDGRKVLVIPPQNSKKPAIKIAKGKENVLENILER